MEQPLFFIPQFTKSVFIKGKKEKEIKRNKKEIKRKEQSFPTRQKNTKAGSTTQKEKKKKKKPVSKNHRVRSRSPLRNRVRHLFSKLIFRKERKKRERKREKIEREKQNGLIYSLKSHQKTTILIG